MNTDPRQSNDQLITKLSQRNLRTSGIFLVNFSFFFEGQKCLIKTQLLYQIVNRSGKCWEGIGRKERTYFGLPLGLHFRIADESEKDSYSNRDRTYTGRTKGSHMSCTIFKKKRVFRSKGLRKRVRQTRLTIGTGSDVVSYENLNSRKPFTTGSTVGCDPYEFRLTLFLFGDVVGKSLDGLSSFVCWCREFLFET